MGIEFDREYSQGQIDNFFSNKDKATEKKYLIITTDNKKLVVKAVKDSELNLFQRIWAKVGLGNLAFGRVAKLCAREGVVNDGLLKAIEQYNSSHGGLQKVDDAVRHRLLIQQFRKEKQAEEAPLAKLMQLAILQPDLPVIGALLEQGGKALAQQKDSEGLTPLARHIFQSDEPGHRIDEALVKLLLAHGADVNDVGRNGMHLLSTYLSDVESTKEIDHKFVATLLRAGADLNRLDNDGLSALDLAIQLQDTKLVHLLMKRDVTRAQEVKRVVNDFQNSLSAEEKAAVLPALKTLGKSYHIDAQDGMRLLELAVQKKNYQMIHLLLKFERPILQTYNDTLGQERTKIASWFILRAVDEGKSEVLQALLDCGADTKKMDGNYQTALMHAEKAPEMQKKLQEKVEMRLMRAVDRGDLQAVEQFLIQVKFAPENIQELIFAAIGKKNYALASRFCELAGKAVGLSGFTFYFAGIKRPRDIDDGFVAAMVRGGVEAKELSKAFVKLFSQAEEPHEIKIGLLKLFIEMGADVNAKDRDANTCLHYAWYAKDDGLVKWILENTAFDVNKIDIKAFPTDSPIRYQLLRKKSEM